jgi:zeaxanthin glucosyltransferase
MGYYAMLVPPYVGHLNPMTVLGRALQRRGHRVTTITPLAGEAAVRKAGLEYIPIAATEFPPGEWERAAAHAGQRSGLKAIRFTARCLGRLMRGVLRDLPPIIAREHFDGLVMDQIMFGAEGVCEVAGLPLAVACNSLLMHVELAIPPIVFSWPYATSWRGRLRNIVGYALNNSAGWPILMSVLPYRARHRLPFMKIDHMNDMPPSLVQVTQLPAFLDFPRRALPACFHYTGPWIEPAARADQPFPWDRLDGRRLIYASLGTLQNRLEHLFPMIIEACASLDAQLVLALGRKDAPTQEAAPGGTVVVGYAPQLALLERASMVITHAGLNTTLESLARGLPLVALPISNDQPGVAARIRALGLGEFIPIGKVSAQALRTAVESILQSPDYRTRARKCADQILGINGPAVAAELIERAFTTRRPVQQTGQSVIGQESPVQELRASERGGARR